MNVRFNISVWLGAAWAVTAAAAVPANDGAAELLTRVRARYDAVTDFSADITITATTPLGTATTQEGVVYARRPNLFRVEFNKPYQQTVIYDGQYMFVLTPASKQILRYDDGGVASFVNVPAALDDLAANYDAVLGAGAAGGEAELRFTARRVSFFKEIILWVAADERVVTLADLHDSAGGVTSYRFSSYRFNIGVPASRFTCVIPAGAEVVHMGAAGL